MDTPSEFAEELRAIRDRYFHESNFQQGVYALPLDLADEFHQGLADVEAALLALEPEPRVAWSDRLVSYLRGKIDAWSPTVPPGPRPEPPPTRGGATPD